MTGIRDLQQGDSISEMLHDAGFDGSIELRDSLERLRTLVPEQAPAPRADLAALLAAGAHGFPLAGSSTPVTAVMPAVVTAPAPADGTLPPGVPSLADRRRKRRLAAVGGAIISAMSLGAGAVAASSEDFRLNIGRTVGVLFPPADPAPAPARDHARPSPADIPAVPAPPTAAAPAPSLGAAAAPSPGAAAAHATEKPAPPPAGPVSPTDAVPPAVGREGKLPPPDGYLVAPRLPGIPGMEDLGGNGVLRPPGSPVPGRPVLPGG